MSLFDTNFLGEASFMPRRAIGPFTATITLEELAEDELEITHYPVQDGSAITDHAFKVPAALNITVQWGENLAETYAKLLALQASREPFDVVTGKRVYRNMLMTGLRQTTDQLTENVLHISMRLREIFIASVEVVTVPERSKQRNPEKTGATENAGRKSAIKVPPEQADSGTAQASSGPTVNRSALESLFGQGI